MYQQELVVMDAQHPAISTYTFLFQNGLRAKYVSPLLFSMTHVTHPHMQNCTHTLTQETTYMRAETIDVYTLQQ